MANTESDSELVGGLHGIYYQSYGKKAGKIQQDI